MLVFGQGSPLTPSLHLPAGGGEGVDKRERGGGECLAKFCFGKLLSLLSSFPWANIEELFGKKVMSFSSSFPLHPFFFWLSNGPGDTRAALLLCVISLPLFVSFFFPPFPFLFCFWSAGAKGELGDRRRPLLPPPQIRRRPVRRRD